MKFSKYYQPKHRNGGRKPSEKSLEKRRLQAEQPARAEHERELQAWQKFEEAESGNFNGFAFVNIFHERVNKANALYIGESDDGANVSTPFGVFHTGADGITVYFFSKTPKKRVDFNRSSYYF